MTPPPVLKPAPIRLLLPGPRTFGRIADGFRRQGYGVERRGPFRSSVLFVETGDGRFSRHGYRFRLVRTGTSRHWVFEGASGALIEQRAHASEGPAIKGDLLLRPPAGPAVDAARETAGPRALLGLLEVEVAETTYRLATPSGATVSAHVERFTARPARGGPTATGTLVTLDLAEGSVESLAHLGDHLLHHRGLLPSGGDLLDAALKALGLQPPGGPPPDALRVRPEDALAAAARKTLARQAMRLEENIEGTVEGWDDEFLHDMRVAVRRLRCALRLFSPLLGGTRATALREEFRWIGDLLGEVRDLDVFLVNLGPAASAAEIPQAALEDVRERVHLLRERRRATLVRALRSARYTRLLKRLEALARPRSIRAGAAPTVSEGAPPIVARSVGKALKAAAALGSDPPAQALHRLRILFKRGRYACEFFKEAFGGPMEAFVPEAVALQDLLGAHQDADVAAGRVRWAAEELHGADRLDLPGALGLGSLIQAYREEARRNRRGYLKRWKSYRKGIRRLRNEMRKLAREPRRP